MQVSNRTLVTLLIVAMIVSIGGAMINISKLSEISRMVPAVKGITGMGTTGIVNVSLQATANLNVSQTFVDFGVGYVSANTFAARLNSSGNRTNWSVIGGFSPVPLEIENIGNVNLSVSIVSSKNAASYLGGGTSPSFKFLGADKEPGTCTGTTASSLTEIASSGNNNTKNLCSEMRFSSGTNEMYVQIELSIPYDAPTGNKTATITFNATQA